ncbi:MAG TPA: alpha-amylase family protein [Kineosporiaceae bacterium]|nr:alpha-amylase family protein [Kineosporiaceae bacterium]
MIRRTLSDAAAPLSRRALLLRTGAAGVLVAGGLSAALVHPAEASPPATAAALAGTGSHREVRDVSANLWEWNWRSVAKECTTVLGPAGYGSVQVAPPQDSLKRTSLGNGSDTVLHPWWEVYQAVDYKLTSRMGTEAEFRSMVSACRKAGVKVVVDTIINHTTGQGNVSYGGVTYSKYTYPGLYGPSDFHRYPTDCPVPPPANSGRRSGDIQDFNDYRQVWNCELVGLEDLRTASPKVRATLVAYMNKLLRYGVSGFRIDAAKHMSQQDLSAIFRGLRRTVDGTRPYIALEVMPGSPGRISPWAYLPVGNLLGFDYANQIQAAFKSYNNPPNDGNIGDLKVFGASSGLLPSSKELVFVENHDTERNGSTLNYKDPNNVIANEFMLAWPHGTPQVYASFAWSTGDQSPPSDANGLITDTVCDNTTWVCVDRVTGVRNMVGFHNYVGGAPVANWYDDGVNLIAFSRGDRGFFSTNNAKTAKTVTVQTGLRAGTYCDVIHGSRTRSGTCSGPTVQVAGNGKATITVGAYDSVAFTARDRVS